MSQDKPKKEKEIPVPCICGAVPCTVKHGRRHMLSCPNTTSCSMRSRWFNNQQLAVIDWNNAVKSARQERRQSRGA